MPSVVAIPVFWYFKLVPVFFANGMQNMDQLKEQFMQNVSAEYQTTISVKFQSSGVLIQKQFQRFYKIFDLIESSKTITSKNEADLNTFVYKTTCQINSRCFGH